MNQIQWDYSVKLNHLTIQAKFNNEVIISYELCGQLTYSKNLAFEMEFIKDPKKYPEENAFCLTREKEYSYSLRMETDDPYTSMTLKIPQDVLEALWNELKEVCNECN